MSKTTTEEHKAVRRTQQRLRRANALIKQAAELQPGERKCNGKVKIKDPVTKEPILDENGKWTYRPCTNPPIKGGTVCMSHGGRIKKVKAKAQRMLLAAVEPTIVRLFALRDQEDHLPTSLGASIEILKRAGDNAIGAPKKQDAVDMRPIINLGIAVGGVPLGMQPSIKVGLIPSKTAVNGEVVEDDNEDSAD